MNKLEPKAKVVSVCCAVDAELDQPNKAPLILYTCSKCGRRCDTIATYEDYE